MCSSNYLFSLSSITIPIFYRSKLPILADQPWSFLIENTLRSYTKLPDWNKRIVGTTDGILLDEISMYNRTAFIVSSTTANLLIETQKRLNIRGYYNTLIRAGYMAHSFSSINNKFVFWERLNEIIHAIQCAGLYDHWERQNYFTFELRNMKQSLERLAALKDNQRSVNSLDFPIFIVYSWLAGTIVFVLEIIWKKVSALDIVKRKFLAAGVLTKSFRTSEL